MTRHTQLNSPVYHIYSPAAKVLSVLRLFHREPRSCSSPDGFKIEERILLEREGEEEWRVGAKMMLGTPHQIVCLLLVSN